MDLEDQTAPEVVASVPITLEVQSNWWMMGCWKKCLFSWLGLAFWFIDGVCLGGVKLGGVKSKGSELDLAVLI